MAERMETFASGVCCQLLPAILAFEDAMRMERGRQQALAGGVIVHRQYVVLGKSAQRCTASLSAVGGAHRALAGSQPQTGPGVNVRL